MEKIVLKVIKLKSRQDSTIDLSTYFTIWYDMSIGSYNLSQKCYVLYTEAKQCDESFDNDI